VNRSASVTAVAVAVAPAAPVPEHSFTGVLLQLPMEPYRPRAGTPLPERTTGSAIKDAIIRWLDEQI